MNLETTQYLALMSILLLVASVWVRPIGIRISLFAVFSVSGILSHWIEPIALLWLVLFYGACKVTYRLQSKVPRGLGYILVILFSLALGTHALPGFNPILLFENTAITSRTGWEALSFWADKPLVGVVLLTVFFRDRVIGSLSELKKAIHGAVPLILIGMIVVYSIGLGMGYVQFDWSPHALISLWLLRNLLFTVVAEEALFRGVIMKGMIGAFSFTHSKWVALFLSSVLFGIAHIGGGMQYVLLSTVAGCFYGYAMMRTGKIEMAILAHLLLNTGHILLLSYGS